MTTPADRVLGAQRPSWKCGRPPAQKVDEMRGTLHRVTEGGEVLASQRIRWSDWPRLGRGFSARIDLVRGSKWMTARVTSAASRGDVVEFTTSDGTRYRLERQRDEQLT